MRVRDINGELFIDLLPQDVEIMQREQGRSSMYTYFSEGNGSQRAVRMRIAVEIVSEQKRWAT
jgi:hypothetical protein